MKPAPAFSFPVALSWAGGKRVLAHVDGKETIEIATPPEFDSGIAGVWSPEDFLVAAVTSCYAVTLVAIAGRSRVPLHGLHVGAVGRVGPRDDGRLASSASRSRSGSTRTSRRSRTRARRQTARSGTASSPGALAVPVDLGLTVRATEIAA